MNSIVCYKIVEIGSYGEYKTLFHGVDGSRNLPVNIWIKAEKKWAGEGGNKYWTGFHVFKNLDTCEKYLTKFTNQNKQRAIVACYAKNLRPKKSSRGNVFLAEKIMII